MKIPPPPVLVLTACLAAVAVAAPARAVRTAVPRPAAARSVLPFIHDDYAKAVAEARARKVPLFIEAWAPW